MGYHRLLGKKGQITVFIIVALLIVIIVALIFVFRGERVNNTIGGSTQNEIVTERVSSDFRPLQDFVDTCTYDVAKEGIRILGLQGGYIYDDNLVANANDPTVSGANAIYYWPNDEDYKIAYWWYMDSSDSCYDSGSCTFNSNRPELTGGDDSIEGQLERYISEHIEDCLQGFRSFEANDFTITAKRNPKAEVTLGDSDVFVNLDYPLSAQVGNRKQDLNYFNVKLPVYLREIYDAAERIADQEGQTAFLETQLIELIALNSGTESDSLLPPFYKPSAYPINPKQVWTRSEVKNQLSALLSSYVPFFQVLESKNFRYLGRDKSESENTIMKRMIISLDEPYFFQDITFDYFFWWNLYLNIGQSEILQPTRDVPDYLIQFPIVGNALNKVLPYNYQFAYDVSYPVVATIEDDRAFNGEGFVFNIALESNVRDNQPVTGTTVSAAVADDIYQTIYCNPDDFDSGNIKIYAKDNDGNAIEGAVLKFNSIGAGCTMGLTEDHGDGIYFESKFPLAVGGVLSIEAPGYETKKVQLTTQKDMDLTIDDLTLDKIAEKQVKLLVYRNVKNPDGGWSREAQPVELRPSETAFISLTRVKDDILDTDYSTVIYFNEETDAPTVNLLPGTYTVEGNMLFDFTYDGDAITALVIPEEEKPGCFLNIGCDPIVLDEIRFEDVFPEGSLFLDNEHGGTWTITPAELENTNTITFYIIASPYVELNLDMTYDDMEEIGKSDYYTSTYRGSLEPCLGDANCYRSLS